MLCQNCNEKPANIHLTKIINDKRMDIHLCEKCAQENTNINYDYPFKINNFLTDLFDISYNINDIQKIQEKKYVCKNCGLTFEEFKNIGKLGCYECYNTFNEKLTPILKRLHGSASHVGKLPKTNGVQVKEKLKLEELKDQLIIAIKNEEYEKAAKIRDEIRHLEKQQYK